MKYKNLILAAMLCVSLQLATTNKAEAADHLDGPAVSSDPAADITDIFAWMQDSNQINLALNVFPLANETSQFSDSVQYVFNISSLVGFGQVASTSTVICTFSAAQNITCELNGAEVVSDVSASSTAGVTNELGNFRVFAGLRNDPFFFDASNFNAVRTTVRDAAASLEFDEAGCPLLDEATQGVLVSTLTGGVNPPSDFFGSLNVLSIVIQADKNLFGPGPLYSVAASTNRR